MDIQDQTAVVMSTAEAEYRAMADMMQRAVYTQALAKTFEGKRAPVVLRNNCMSAITMVHALGVTKRSKSIELRHHYIKEKMLENNISIKHVPSRTLTAGIFTKALERRRFEKLRQMIGVAEIPQLEQRILSSRYSGGV